MANKLTGPQEKFAQLIVSGKTQADAYRGAYKANKMTDETIHNKASKLMKVDEIRARVAELTEPAIKKVQITAERILEEIAAVAFTDVAQFYNDDGSVKRLDELSDEAKKGVKQYSVKRIKIGRDDFIDVPIINGHDKMKALELLGKTLALFTDKHEHTGTISLKDFIESRKK